MRSRDSALSVSLSTKANSKPSSEQTPAKILLISTCLCSRKSGQVVLGRFHIYGVHRPVDYSRVLRHPAREEFLHVLIFPLVQDVPPHSFSGYRLWRGYGL